MGILYLIATPIGNTDDITIRALRTLFSVEYIACEDTRRTGLLLQNYELRIKNDELRIKDLNITKKPKLISYYDEVEEIKAPEIIEFLENGNDVGLVSDAGTPLIADPGFKLVRECLKRNIKVESIPGPSSVITALVSSGLPSNQFLFLGYLPEKQTKRKKTLDKVRRLLGESHEIKPTIIFFETPHRIKESLEDLKETFGDTEIVIARELTKIHEEVWRGKVSEAFKRVFKGELVVIFNYKPGWSCTL